MFPWKGGARLEEVLSEGTVGGLGLTVLHRGVVVNLPRPGCFLLEKYCLLEELEDKSFLKYDFLLKFDSLKL